MTFRITLPQILKDSLVRPNYEAQIWRDIVTNISKRVLYINFGTKILSGRPRNRWQDGVRGDGRIVGGEGW